MDKMISIVKRNWAYLVGAAAGGVGGYFYWLYVGCSTGTCPITSSPIMSTIVGALMGSLLFSTIFTTKNKI